MITLKKEKTNILANVILNGKASVKIKANKKSNDLMSGKSTLYICESGAIWVPNSVCKYFQETKTLIIHEWFFNKLIVKGDINIT